MITDENFEGYLMRYADGELGAEEAAMVEAFLDTHPEFRDELEAITDPSLKITPPLVTMPGKEKLLKPVAAAKVFDGRPVWIGMAASIAILLVFGIVLRMGPQNGGTIVARHEILSPVSVTDTPLPDSLYIGRGKPAPVNLAKHIIAITAQECVAEIEYQDADILPTDTVAVIVEPEQTPLLADNVTAIESEPTTRHGNVIVIETDQLVSLTPKPKERNDMHVASVIENNNIALAGEKSLVGKAIDAVTRFILHRTDADNLYNLAFSE